MTSNILSLSHNTDNSDRELNIREDFFRLPLNRLGIFATKKEKGKNCIASKAEL